MHAVSGFGGRIGRKLKRLGGLFDTTDCAFIDDNEQEYTCKSAGSAGEDNR